MIILTFTSYYLPGFKGGGPTKSLANLVDRLGEEYQFRIVTRDRDVGERVPYPLITRNGWNKVGKADVFYLEPGQIGLSFLRGLLRSTSYDVLYLNSLFSPGFTIRPLVLRRLGLVPRTPVIVAPRGELTEGALNIKAAKKRTYLAAARAFDLYRDVIWQVSSAYEQDHLKTNIKSIVRRDADKFRSVIATDLISREVPVALPLSSQRKVPGKLKVVFLSRISRMKNLDVAIKILDQVKGDVIFDIYGPLEDAAYWRECEKRIALLPENIGVRYKGSIQAEDVIPTLSRYDLFFLPTQGENYGHVILEALSAGCPVLISDRTPWRNLESEGVGWDFPLEEPSLFATAIQKCVDMDGAELGALAERARIFAGQYRQDQTSAEQNRKLFRIALNGGGSFR